MKWWNHMVQLIWIKPYLVKKGHVASSTLVLPVSNEHEMNCYEMLVLWRWQQLTLDFNCCGIYSMLCKKKIKNKKSRYCVESRLYSRQYTEPGLFWTCLLNTHYLNQIFFISHIYTLFTVMLFNCWSTLIYVFSIYFLLFPTCVVNFISIVIVLKFYS